MITEDFAKNGVVTIYGASTDTKPTDYRDGSIFVETDTHDVYMWDEKNETWGKM